MHILLGTMHIADIMVQIFIVLLADVIATAIWKINNQENLKKSTILTIGLVCNLDDIIESCSNSTVQMSHNQSWCSYNGSIPKGSRNFDINFSFGRSNLKVIIYSPRTLTAMHSIFHDSDGKDLKKPQSQSILWEFLCLFRDADRGTLPSCVKVGMIVRNMQEGKLSQIHEAKEPAPIFFMHA